MRAFSGAEPKGMGSPRTAVLCMAKGQVCFIAATSVFRIVSPLWRCYYLNRWSLSIGGDIGETTKGPAERGKTRRKT